MNNLKTILFIGNYPNAIEPTKNCFFQTLIHCIADNGYRCIVISPVSLTHYGKKVLSIPCRTEEFAPKGGKIEVIYPKFITFSSINLWKFRTGRLSEKNYQRTVLKAIRHYKLSFDYTYGHFFLVGGLAAVKAGRKYKKPSFIAFGEDSYEDCVSIPYGELKKNDIQGLQGIVAVSTHNANILAEKDIFKGIPVLVAPNATDAAMMAERDKNECRKILGIDPDKFVVGFVGSFEHRKGDERLFDAVNALDDVYVAFAGQGRKYSGEKVVFCKPLKRDLMPIFMHAIDIFCLPTLSEGCSNAIVEALASGLPVISSDLPFNDDILNINNSIRINSNNVHEISRAIACLHDNNTIREKLAFGAKQSAKNLTIEERTKKIIEFIDNE